MSNSTGCVVMRKAGDMVAAGELAALRNNLRDVQAEVAALRATVARLCTELGLPQP